MGLKVRLLLITLVLLFLTGSGFSQPWPNGQMFALNWPDNRNAAFSFTFDDGTMSHYTYARPVLDSLGFKASFFLPTSFLRDSLPAYQRYGLWSQFQSMYLEGHEIGSHSVTHPDLTLLPVGDTLTPGTGLYELYQSKKIIEQKIPGLNCVSFAYPNLNFDSSIIGITSMFYESARTGSSFITDSALKGTGFYRIGAKEELFNSPRNSTADDLDEMQDFKNYVQLAIYSGKWAILEGHEVVPFSQIPGLYQTEYFPMSTEWLTSLGQWLKQKSDNKELWVETQGNVIRYMKERENILYDVIYENDYRLKFNVTANLDKDIYNYPLSVLILVPSTWNRVVVTQDTNIDTVFTTHDGTDTYLIANVIPNRGTLNLREINLEFLAMPVELSTFTASFTDKGIKLNWITSTEVNNNQFIVEKMSADKSWKSIASLKGAGNSNVAKVYSFTDPSSLSNGKYSYRLKMIDNDGKFEYSDIVSLEINSIPQNYSLAQNYPNPFNPSTKIHYELSNGQFVTLKIYNVLGKEVQTLVNEEKLPGAYELNWNANNLPSGVYYYRLQAGNFTETKKMMLMK